MIYPNSKASCYSRFKEMHQKNCAKSKVLLVWKNALKWHYKKINEECNALCQDVIL